MLLMLLLCTASDSPDEDELDEEDCVAVTSPDIVHACILYISYKICINTKKNNL